MCAKSLSQVQEHIRTTDEDSPLHRSIHFSGNDSNLIPLWRSATLLQAEKLFSGSGSHFNLDNLPSSPGSDFSGRCAVQCWTLDLEGAKLFAEYYKQIAAPVEIVLVKIELPRSTLTQGAMTLRYPEDGWKQLVFSSRRGKDPERKDLARRIAGAEVLIGDVSTLNSVSEKELEDWTEIGEKHLLKLPSGEVITQVVFGHNMGSEFEERIREYECKVTIHLV